MTFNKFRKNLLSILVILVGLIGFSGIALLGIFHYRNANIEDVGAYLVIASFMIMVKKTINRLKG